MPNGQHTPAEKPKPLEPLAIPVKEMAALLGVGLTTAWRIVASEEVDTLRLGRRTLVTVASLRRYVGDRVVAERLGTPTRGLVKPRTEAIEPGSGA